MSEREGNKLSWRGFECLSVYVKHLLLLRTLAVFTFCGENPYTFFSLFPKHSVLQVHVKGLGVPILLRPKGRCISTLEPEGGQVQTSNKV